MAWTELALAFVPLLVIVDPLASVGLYLGLSAGFSMRARMLVALKACAFAAAMLLVFAFVGKEILEVFGIEIYSLRIAGGILLVLIGLQMLKEGEEIPHDEIPLPTGGSHRAGRNDPSFVPLGLPMLAGPGAISLVIVQAPDTSWGILAGAVLITMAASLFTLVLFARMHHVIGVTATKVITRIMGLLTVAFAVQYVLDGIEGWLDVVRA